MIFGRTDTQELLDLPLIEGQVDKSIARTRFHWSRGPLPLVPFIDSPRPPDTPHTIWHAGEIWNIDSVVRTWTPQTVEPSLESARIQMATILNGLPIYVQAKLWGIRLHVEDALDRGRIDIARAIIEQTEIPEELTTAKQKILELFPK